MFSILEPLIPMPNIWLLIRHQLFFLKYVHIFFNQRCSKSKYFIFRTSMYWMKYLKLLLGDMQLELCFHFWLYKGIWKRFCVLRWLLLDPFWWNTSARVGHALKEAEFLRGRSMSVQFILVSCCILNQHIVNEHIKNSPFFFLRWKIQVCAHVLRKFLCSNPDISVWNALTNIITVKASWLQLSRPGFCSWFSMSHFFSRSWK